MERASAQVPLDWGAAASWGSHEACVTTPSLGCSAASCEISWGCVRIAGLTWLVLLLHEELHGAYVHFSSSTCLALLLHEVFQGACVHISH